MDRIQALIAVPSLAVAALLAACSLGPEGAPIDAVPPHLRISFPSVAACGACHQRVYSEWAKSLHAGAWTNANILSATSNFAKEECRPCHSPMPVLLTGLRVAPPYRDFNQEDGVHCLSCHGLEDGVAATRTIEGAPCAPKEDERIAHRDMCYPCHEPTHQAYQEYRVSVARAEGVRCTDCHMPRRHGAPGRSHGPHGGLDPEFVKRGLEWSSSLEEGEVRVRVRNRTGHKFPGEIPSRSFVVRVDFDRGEPVSELLRKQNKKEARADNRLLPDETRVLSFPLPEDATSARVRLLWKPFPLMADEQAHVLGERTVSGSNSSTSRVSGARRDR